MAGRPTEPGFSRRERQLMDAAWRRGRATAQELLSDLPDPPSYSAVRTTLRILVDKGHLQVEREGERGRYVYRPTQKRDAAARGALARLVQTFFGGSREKAALALLDLTGDELDEEQLERLQERIARARSEGR